LVAERAGEEESTTDGHGDREHHADHDRAGAVALLRHADARGGEATLRLLLLATPLVARSSAHLSPSSWFRAGRRVPAPCAGGRSATPPSAGSPRRATAPARRSSRPDPPHHPRRSSRSRSTGRAPTPASRPRRRRAAARPTARR